MSLCLYGHQHYGVLLISMNHSCHTLYCFLCCLGSGGEEDEADLMPPPPRQKKRVNQNVSQSTSSASLSKSIIQGRADIRVSSAVLRYC